MEINAVLLLHRGLPQIALYFLKDHETNLMVRSIPGSRWSATHQAWLVPDSDENRTRFHLQPAGLPGEIASCSATKPDATSKATAQLMKTSGMPVLRDEVLIKIDQFILWLRSKRYSDHTIKTYTEAIRVFLGFHANIPLEAISVVHVISFNNAYILKRKLSASYQNQVVNAVKLFFSVLERTSLQIKEIHRPRRAHHLPNVLSNTDWTNNIVQYRLSPHCTICLYHRHLLPKAFGIRFIKYWHII